ncbi:MAG: hypothetical protein ABIE42_06900 [Candidatus Eisenbacteria bacterium]
MGSRFMTGALIAVAIVAVLAASSVFAEETEEMADKKMMMKKEVMEMPFGGEADVAFAKALWTAMDEYSGWIMQSEIMPGKSPHGMYVRMYYSIVTIDGMAYHVVVKDNYGGEGVTLEMVKERPGDYLIAVTPMLQREQGYDSDNNDWYWVKYGTDGSVAMNDTAMAMAGRVAKGMPMGCIACHANAADGDYLFAND